jgi:hypothetical protein
LALPTGGSLGELSAAKHRKFEFLGACLDATGEQREQHDNDISAQHRDTPAWTLSFGYIPMGGIGHWV